MAVLSDASIRNRLRDAGGLAFLPSLDESQIKPSSVDLRLGALLRLPRQGVHITYPYTEVADEALYELFTLTPTARHTIKPGELVLAQTFEQMTLPRDLTGRIESRSSLVRMGLDVGISSYINPGYQGYLPVAIKNIGTFHIELALEMLFCQLVLEEVPGVETAYGEDASAKYHGEQRHIAPKLWRDYDRSSRAQHLVEKAVRSVPEGFALNALTPQQRHELGL